MGKRSKVLIGIVVVLPWSLLIFSAITAIKIIGRLGK
jgi:hypothetical protein